MVSHILEGVLAGGILTAIGACATIAFLLLQWRTTTIREQQADWRTTVLESETARARADLGTAQASIAEAQVKIAEANNQAKQAELKLAELRQRVGPRVIDEAKFLDAIKSPVTANVLVKFSPDVPDGYSTAYQIVQLLRKAGWTVEHDARWMEQDDPNLHDAPQNGAAPPVLDPTGKYDGPLTTGSGIMIVWSDEDAGIKQNGGDFTFAPTAIDTAREALSTAFTRCLGVTSAHTDPNVCQRENCTF